MNRTLKLLLVAVLALMLVPYSYANEWVPPDIIRMLEAPALQPDSLVSKDSRTMVSLHNPKDVKTPENQGTSPVVQHSSLNEWVPPDTLQQLQTLFQLGGYDPKGAVAAPIIRAQVTGTQSLKTNPRREIALDDQRGNDWWSEQPIIMTGTATQSLKIAPSREVSLDDQRGNDWWSEQPVIMTGTGAQPLKTTPSRGISLDDQLGNDWWSEQPTSESPVRDQISLQVLPGK